MKRLLLLFLLFVAFKTYAQKQDRIWCFGSNTGIDFNDTLNPVPFTSVLPKEAMGSYASIADNNGNLLFYTAGVRWDTLGARVWNESFQTMQNGDSIRGQPNRAQCLLIIPYPGDSNRYYLFSSSYSPVQKSLYYSVIDMSLQGGYGEVVQKNIFLMKDTLADKMVAVKHANGRDWWVLLRRAVGNTFYKYLVTPTGINGPFLQDIGTFGTSNNPLFQGEMQFSNDGERLAVVSWNASIDLLDFDRCSGILSNFIDAGEHIPNTSRNYNSCVFSLNRSKLYVASVNININDTKYVYQYDLNAGNILSSKQTIWSYADTLNFFLGFMMLAPDARVYVAKGVAYGPDSNTVYDQNLDYITYPDSLGGACAYCSNCFSLNGHGLSEYGLPNMPNYNLGAITGSPCDSLTAVAAFPSAITRQLFVYYDAGWQTAFINAQGLLGKNCMLQITDMNGKEVYSSSKSINPPYFTSDVNLHKLSAGVYIVRLSTEKEVLQKEFVKE